LRKNNSSFSWYNREEHFFFKKLTRHIKMS